MALSVYNMPASGNSIFHLLFFYGHRFFIVVLPQVISKEVRWDYLKLFKRNLLANNAFGLLKNICITFFIKKFLILNLELFLLLCVLFHKLRFLLLWSLFLFLDYWIVFYLSRRAQEFIIRIDFLFWDSSIAIVRGMSLKESKEIFMATWKLYILIDQIPDQAIISTYYFLNK